MPMNPAVQAVIKAITRLQPDVANSWNSQRKVEDAAGKLTIADPRCRIDKITATADDGYEIPLRVFTPLDIDFSLKRGLHVNEDHHPVLARRRLGQRRRGILQRRLHAHGAEARAPRHRRRLPAQPRAPLPHRA